MSHPDIIIIGGVKLTPLELAEMIENLRYDVCCDVLTALSDAFSNRSAADIIAGKPKLGRCLYNVGKAIDAAAIWTQEAWLNCKPHIGIEEK